MVNLITWVSVGAAALLFIVALIDLAQSWGKTVATTDLVKKGAEKATEVASSDDAKLKEYAGIDLKGNWEALATLASSLKDLDRSSRLFTLSLAFLAVAGATVGLDAIGSGLAS